MRSHVPLTQGRVPLAEGRVFRAVLVPALGWAQLGLGLAQPLEGEQPAVERPLGQEPSAGRRGEQASEARAPQIGARPPLDLLARRHGGGLGSTATRSDVECRARPVRQARTPLARATRPILPGQVDPDRLVAARSVPRRWSSHRQDRRSPWSGCGVLRSTEHSIRTHGPGRSSGREGDTRHRR